MTPLADRDLLGLEGAVALVTGAGSGIGRATALLLARAGCDVAAADINAKAVDATAAEIQAVGQRSVAIYANVTVRKDVRRMVEEARETLGSLDVAVNVVGGLGDMRPKPFVDFTLDEWNIPIELNLTSTMLCMQAEALAMVRDKRPGRIVNFASSSGVVGAANISNYGAANAGIIHFTKSTGLELAPYGIRVNCVIPGMHFTESKKKTYDDPKAPPGFRAFWDNAMHAHPLGRVAEPDEAAGVVLFLASKLSSYMTGHSVISDGGITHTTARGTFWRAEERSSLEELGATVPAGVSSTSDENAADAQ